jgi:hypothetical protein
MSEAMRYEWRAGAFARGIAWVCFGLIGLLVVGYPAVLIYAVRLGQPSSETLKAIVLYPFVLLCMGGSGYWGWRLIYRPFAGITDSEFVTRGATGPVRRIPLKDIVAVKHTQWGLLVVKADGGGYLASILAKSWLADLASIQTRADRAAATIRQAAIEAGSQELD